MKRFFISFIFLSLCLIAPQNIHAQGPSLDVVDNPVCFTIRNTAPYTVHGNFTTNYYPDPFGVEARHRSNFKLMAKGTKNEEGTFDDRAEFCTYGPFYPGRKLELTLRTLFPIFSCMTRVDQGEIIVMGKRKPEGGTETKAICFD